jgi:hypothetical protein
LQLQLQQLQLKRRCQRGLLLHLQWQRALWQRQVGQQGTWRPLAEAEPASQIPCAQQCL